MSGYIQDGPGRGCSLGGVSGYIQDGYGHGGSVGGLSGCIEDGYDMDVVSVQCY